MSKHSNELLISEIFYSFQGESTLTGRPTVFIRLAECNLNCSICDTKYAFNVSKKLDTKDIIKTIKTLKSPYICITGGEPLLQKGPLKHLLSELIKLNKIISIETNGSIDIKDLPRKIKKVIDVKTPSTDEEKSFKIANLKYITKNDEIKFVISDYNDFNFSIKFIKSHRLEKIGVPLLFSPNLTITGLASNLISWILKSKLPLIFQPQLHKLIKEKPLYLVKRT